MPAPHPLPPWRPGRPHAARSRWPAGPRAPPPAWTPTGSRSTTLVARLRDACAEVTAEPAAWPRPAATGGRWPCAGRPRARSPAWPPRSPGPRRRRGGRRAGPLPRGPRAGHRRRGAQRRVRRRRAGARRRGARPHRPVRHRRRRRHLAGARRPGRHVRRRRSSTSCGPTTASRVGHWPQSVDLSTVGGWLACRRRGQLSGRYGKIEDIVRRPRRRARRRPPDHHRRLAPRPRSAPTSTSCSWAARARSASSPAPGCACTPPRATSGAAPGCSARSTRASTPCAASCSAAPPRPCCGSTTPPRPTAPTTHGRLHLLLASTRATARWSTPRSGSSPRSAARRRPPAAMRPTSSTGWTTATTSPRSRR